MVINKKFEKALNKQIHLEWVAQYNFLAMSAWLETTPFKGFAKWMLMRSMREQKHAIQLFEYLRNRYGTLELPAIEEPEKSFRSPVDVFQKALGQKRIVSDASRALYALAVKEKDLETMELLHPFLSEQVAEEKHMQDILDKIVLADDQADALIHLDYKEELSYAGAH
jgi:ferritin